MKAVLCPICNGKGVVWGGFESGGVPCHGCAEWGSKGWLLVPEQEDLPTPYVDGNDTIAYDTTDTYKPIFSY